MSAKKLLLLNGSYAEVPLIVEAKRLGWHVITSGNNRTGLGHAYADENIFGDYSDCEFVYRLAKEQSVDAVVANCNDFAYLSAAYACEKLGLPGHDSYETAQIIHSKINFRKLLRDLNLPTPKFDLCSTADEAKSACRSIDFPLIVKPTDLSGGRGMSVCRSESEIEAAFEKAQQATRKSAVLLEQFLTGTYHAANVFIRAHKVVRAFFDDEQYYLNPYLVAGASSPSNLRHHTMEQAIVYIEKIAEHLRLVDGMFHVQFIDQDGTPFFTDPCRRAPGDLYPRLIQYSTGFNCAREVIRAECGEPFSDLKPDRQTHRFIARECILPDRNGVVENVFIDPSIEARIIDRMVWSKRGDVIDDHLNHKAGILFLEFNGFDEMQSTLAKFYELVKIELH